MKTHLNKTKELDEFEKWLDSTYELRLTCSNCGQVATYRIAKGTTHPEVRCSNCGCQALHKGLE